jgi:L-aspartate oxidase
LSEALRGEGAYLRNASGERFMGRYHPLQELAPRDVVSRAISTEITNSNVPNVSLDLTHLTPGFIRKRFPRIYETCLHYGIDLETMPAPVRPAAHYAMGGIRTDLFGRTTVPRLYAAGEAACTGVHGANRLASNSLLEGVVFGARAGAAMTELRDERSAVANCHSPTLFPAISEAELRSLAWQNCGVIRNGPELSAACAWLQSARFELRPTPARADFELRNMHQVAYLIAAAAKAREESRGAHYRIDFPQKSPQLEKHSILKNAGTGVNAQVRFA